MNRIFRDINAPPRTGLSWDELWLGEDKGLICCWERGRAKRAEDYELSQRAENGELVILAWTGGVEKKLEAKTLDGTMYYLATWQGLRNENLDIQLVGTKSITCSKTGQIVVFKHHQ